MLSMQEIVDRTVDQQKRIKRYMNSFSFYHPDMRGGKDDPTASITEGMTRPEAHEIMANIRSIPLKEFIAKSGTTGMSGAAYLVPVKVHDLLLNYSEATDKVPYISRKVIYDWKGDEWTLSIANDHNYVPQPFSSGGNIADMNIDATQVSLAFDVDRTLGINISVGLDLLEDVSDYDVIDWHIQQAARAFGRTATDRALAALLAGADGVGTLNSGNTGDADETKLTGGATTDIILAVRKLGDDRFLADTLITTPEAWGHSISMQAAPTGWDTLPTQEGFTNRIGQLDVLQSTSPNLHDSADLAEAAFTACISIIYSRGDALVTGRKRWLRVNNYANPVADLAGAVVVGAQDSVTCYKDSIFVLTET
jgi:hypothetical protein